jgi:hypothetical protein
MKHNSLTCQFSKQLAVKFNFAFFVILISNIFSCNVCYSQEVSDFARLRNANFPQEKIYLHIDKTLYTAGDDLWFKVYLVDAGTHKPEALSTVVYADLLSPLFEIVTTKTIKIDEGCGNGDFKLPIDLGSGEYTVRAYTTYMRNFDDAFFFRKKIYIKQVRQNITDSGDSNQEEVIESSIKFNSEILKPDVQFFPEGGYLVCGFLNQIGIKALGPDGKGIDISGTITDNSGSKVMEFSTLKFGLGMIKMIPREGEKYKARIFFNGDEYFYDLPNALINGAVMQVNEEEDIYKVIVYSSLKNSAGNFSFISMQKNNIVSITEIPYNDTGKILIVPKDIFIEGIAQFTLLDSNNNPLCERLVFVEDSDFGLNVNLSPSKKEYGKRELVELDFSTEQSFYKMPEAKMSVAVAQMQAMPENLALDIKSQLLLKSEIKGEIEQPGYYFHSDDPQRKKVLDLLMMTQGWRRFVWNDTLNTNAPALTFPVETGLRFEGRISRFYNRMKQKEAVISLTCNNNDEFSQFETDADKQGHFKFENIVFWDSTSVVIQAKDDNGKEGSKENPGNYFIEMDSLPPPIEFADRTYDDSISEIFNNNYPVSSLTMEEIDSLFKVKDGDILLDEILVSAKKKDRIAKKRLLYKEPNHHINFDKLRDQVPNLNVLAAINGRVPGFDFAGNTITLRGDTAYSKNSGGILFLLDGFPVDWDAIITIPMQNIHFVDILKGPKATIYGPEAHKAVIAVYTLDAEDILDFTVTKERKGIISFIHPGFSRPREFYVPVYSTNESKQEGQDNRTTLYWNPTVKLDEQGNSKVTFYTSDLYGTYKVVLEGISAEGEIINSETFFEVKE